MRLRRVAAMAVLGAAAAGSGAGPAGAGPDGAACATRVTTRIFYDTTGEFGFLGERYATMTANLVSRFGSWSAAPIAAYEPGDLSCADAVVYLGSTYDEPIPDAFLADVAADTTPVMWIWENLWKLEGRLPVTEGAGPDPAPYDQVHYQGRQLTRAVHLDAALSTHTLGADAEVLATTSGAGTPSRPWATRLGELIYLSENPLAYISGTDRYLAFIDLLYELIAPDTRERHRAMVRLEDVSPSMDPAMLRTAVDALIDEDVPFSIAVIPEYHDGDGSPAVRLRDRPELVAVLHRALTNRGSLVMHGVTHQIDGLDNPYDGESAADYEFFRAIIDGQDDVRLVGPVPGDSYEWARTRMEQGLAEFEAAGLPRPRVITPPHYAASPEAYRAMADLFEARFDRGLYFDGQLSTGTADPTEFFDQFFAYPITDVHGTMVIPENLGNESPEILNNHAERGVDALVASAEAALVVRDGFATFFWHPYLVNKAGVGVDHLREIVRGIRGLGYTFIGLPELVPSAAVYEGEVSAPPEASDLRPWHVLLAGLTVWLPIRWRRRGRARIVEARATMGR